MISGSAAASIAQRRPTSCASRWETATRPGSSLDQKYNNNNQGQILSNDQNEGSAEWGGTSEGRHGEAVGQMQAVADARERGARCHEPGQQERGQRGPSLPFRTASGAGPADRASRLQAPTQAGFLTWRFWGRWKFGHWTAAPSMLENSAFLDASWHRGCALFSEPWSLGDADGCIYEWNETMAVTCFEIIQEGRSQWGRNKICQESVTEWVREWSWCYFTYFHVCFRIFHNKRLKLALPGGGWVLLHFTLV